VDQTSFAGADYTHVLRQRCDSVKSNTSRSVGHVPYRPHNQ